MGKTRELTIATFALAPLVLWLACSRSETPAVRSTDPNVVNRSTDVECDQPIGKCASDICKRVLLRLNPESTTFEDKKLLLVFHRGASCVQCVSQLSLLGHRVDEFTSLGIEIIGICPKMPPKEIMDKFKSTLHIDFPVIADKSLELFREVDCLDENDRVLHGLFLIDKSGQISWQAVSEHPVTNIDEILGNCSLLR